MTSNSQQKLWRKSHLTPNPNPTWTILERREEEEEESNLGATNLLPQSNWAEHRGMIEEEKVDLERERGRTMKAKKKERIENGGCWFCRLILTDRDKVRFYLYLQPQRENGVSKTGRFEGEKMGRQKRWKRKKMRLDRGGKEVVKEEEDEIGQRREGSGERGRRWDWIEKGRMQWKRKKMRLDEEGKDA